MTQARRTLLLCNCNKTIPVDGKAVGNALECAAPRVGSELCRRQVAIFEAAAKNGDDLIVGCTQEAPFFRELAGEAQATGDIRFVNIREMAGWSQERERALPKMAALLAAAQLPPPEPVPVVSYESKGELLIAGPGGAAIAWADQLAEQLGVEVIVTDATGWELPLERHYPVSSGTVREIKGHLGAFEVAWEQVNPIDLEACTRCNACIAACPEHAIDYSYQIDLDRCRAHRACVKACGEVRAIDFERRERRRSAHCDLVLDLSAEPLLKMFEPPQGYFAPGRDPLDQAQAARQLAQMVGEFEKPQFFAYRHNICAHSRSGISGCTKCIDVCSTGAIAPDGDCVKVDPHLCMGCGGCASVCPSGAMAYAYPRMADLGLRIKTLIGAYRKAGGGEPCLLLHNAADGRELIMTLGRRGKGLPARVLPLEMHHVAALGMDAMLGAFAYGAAQVAVLCLGNEAPTYLASLKQEIGYARQILSALGYGDHRLEFIEARDGAALEKAVWNLPLATSIAAPAAFNWSNDKRTTLDFVFEHLLRHAPAPHDAIALGSGAPYGQVMVNKQACTLCMACVGACPEGALVTGREQPQLKFIEQKCVQCGLCAKTCPEDAIRLAPRLLLAKDAKSEVVLHEAEPFACVKCGKPFATRQVIEAMVGRLTSHAMFAEPGAIDRLKMCADCRVVDLLQGAQHGSILDL